MVKLRQAVVVLALMLVGVGVGAQDARPLPAVDAQSVRLREAATYLTAVHAAQRRAFAEKGRYLPLHEIRDLPSIPVGFVPRLMTDQWSYVVSLKDLFDVGGLAMFLDDRGTIYDAVARPRVQGEPPLQSRQ